MMQIRKSAGVVGVVLLLAVGCAKSDKPEAKGSATASDGGPKVEASKTPAAPPEITLKTVNYQGLMDAVKAEKGSVVVVDVWATTCVPCKKEFPHFVELHEKKGNEGVTCISVSVDKKEDFDQALKYLKDKKATFTNLWLDEAPEVWFKKWNIKEGVPVAFVFDRQGKMAKKFTNEDQKAPPFTYEDVTKVVDELLKTGSF
jgi:thiol-disulfide isomerase/thioredoxin